MKRKNALFAPELPLEVISNIVGRVDLLQLLRCAAVNSTWRAAVAATAAADKHFTLERASNVNPTVVRNLLKSHVKSLKTLTVCGIAGSSSIVGSSSYRQAGLQQLLPRHAAVPFQDYSDILDDLAAATRLESVSLEQVPMACNGRHLLAALASLPALQELRLCNLQDVWGTDGFIKSEAFGWPRRTQDGCAQRNAPSKLIEKLIEKLTKLSKLELRGEPMRALLNNLSAATRLQQLTVSDMTATIGCYYGLRALTSLHINGPAAVVGHPAALSTLTPLRQLQLPYRHFAASQHAQPGPAEKLLAALAPLQKLTSLCLTDTQLVGARPGFSQLSALRQLQIIGAPREAGQFGSADSCFALAVLAAPASAQLCPSGKSLTP